MDKSADYINMCEQAVEIQKKWVSELGDFYTTNVSIGMEEYNTYVFMGLLDEGFIWLPRQDQLQDMLREKYPNHYMFLKDMIIGFRNWFFEEDLFMGMEHFDSMEQLWLAYVMHELYSKQWSGTEWVLKK